MSTARRHEPCSFSLWNVLPAGARATQTVQGTQLCQPRPQTPETPGRVMFPGGRGGVASCPGPCIPATSRVTQPRVTPRPDSRPPRVSRSPEPHTPLRISLRHFAMSPPDCRETVKHACARSHWAAAAASALHGTNLGPTRCETRRGKRGRAARALPGAQAPSPRFPDEQSAWPPVPAA